MIPILFDSNATEFTTNGIGTLKDCLSCEATEGRNGIFELVMTYPITGVLYEEIETGRILVVNPNKKQKRQAFDIYSISKPISGVVVINACHVGYRQSYVPIKPFQADGITATLEGLKINRMEENNFDFWTDLTNEESSYVQNMPRSLRKCLGGDEGSILDVFSGSGAVEYEWDNFTTKIWTHRGRDNGVQLRCGKNITDLKQLESIDDLVTGVLPMWSDIDNTVCVYGDIQYSQYASLYPFSRTEVLDLSSEYENAPTREELNGAALRYVSREGVGLPVKSLKVSFIDLSGTDAYQNIALLETVNLCDTVKIVVAPLGISYDAKVIKTVWDVLAERYIEVEIGATKSTISKTIADSIGDISSLNLSNNKLVSVTRKVDREVGEITETVSTVYSDIYDSDDGLKKKVEQNTSSISQNSEAIDLRVTKEAYDKGISDINEDIQNESNRIAFLETRVSVETELGLVIRQNGDATSFVAIGNSGMDIYAENNIVAYARKDGFAANTFITGEWHMQPTNNQQTFILFRKPEA